MTTADPRTPVFDAISAKVPNVWNEPGNMHAMHNLLDAFSFPREASPPPFDRAAFLARYVNRTAAAIDNADIAAAAKRLGVPSGHIQMLKAIESAGRSFDASGRPIILPEPHVFYRLTDGRYGTASYSYPRWGQRPYPSSFDARWDLLADMAAKDEAAALQSASWGLFQVMGFHWKLCGYDSPQAFAKAMAADEGNHLEAMVAFIEAEGLADELRACRKGDPDSCRAFARGYNGSGYAKNGYHTKMAAAL